MARRNRTKTGELVPLNPWRKSAGPDREDVDAMIGAWVVQLLDANNHARTMCGAYSDSVCTWDWGPSLHADIFETEHGATIARRQFAPSTLESWVSQIDEAYLIAARLIDSKEPPE